MIKDIPVLVIVIPILGALLAPILGRFNRTLVWYLVVIVTMACFAGSLSLLHSVFEHGRISYWLGGWEPPWGIEYVVDYLNGFVLSIVAFTAFIAAIYARKSVEQEIEEEKTHIFYTIYLLFVAGLMGIVITGDLFNLYVFLEISSLTAYALIAVGRRRDALMASYNYLIMGTIGATFILLGIGHLYLVTGSLNMADLGARLPELYHSSLVHTAFAFFAIGLSIKVALFPLHNWLPNAYTHAPSIVSALMAATSTKVGAYALIRVMFTVFKPEFLVLGIQVERLFLLLSVVAIIFGSILAIAQTNIKKMLAYSSVGQIGYIILGVSLLNVTGIQGSLIHILNHALMKGCLFLVVGAVVYRLGITNINDFKGLGKKMPVCMAAFTVAALSMIGIPLTVGFISKWYLVIASLEAGMWPLVPVLLLSSLMMAVYFWRVLDNIYFQPYQPANPGPGTAGQPRETGEVPALMLWPTVILAALCLVFGVLPGLPLSIAEMASTVLLR